MKDLGMKIRRDKSTGPIFQNTEEILDHFAKFFQHVERVSKTCLDGGRYTGNACVRDLRDGTMYITRTNMPKRKITCEDLVPCVPHNSNELCCYGPFDPSSDTLRRWYLFQKFPKISMILHAHTYIVGEEAWKTREILFNDDIENQDETEEILRLVEEKNLNPQDIASAHINVIGHGCLIMTSDSYKTSYQREGFQYEE